MKNKKYKVMVYPSPHVYEDVEAKTPADAEDAVMLNNFYDNFEVHNVIVRIECKECGYDNKAEAKKCGSCDEVL